MNIAKKSITLLIVPAFSMATVMGCAQQDSGVSVSPEVEKTTDGALAATELYELQEFADNLNKSYQEAKSNGYTGTYEDWVKLLELHQTDPKAAEQQAKDSGFDTLDLLMAGAMGAMLGNMMSNSSYRSMATSNTVRTTSSATRSSGTTTRGGFGGATSTGG